MHLTPIWGILGTSGSVISGQKIQSYFFGFDDVIPDRTFFVSWWSWTTSVTLTIRYRMKSCDVIVRRYHVIGKIIPKILGFELASFSDKKSRCVWERQWASFLDKKSNANYFIQIWRFFKKFYFGNWASVILGQKTQTTFRIFCPEMTLTQFPNKILW